MELTNEFTVKVPPEQAWAVLTDVERIAPCMPGAQLQEVEGDEFRGTVKVKVGPITAQYKGKARFLEKDDTGHKAVLRAEGRDTKGAGNANATITATLEPAGDGTKVKVVTDLSVTGKVAQFGRGVLADVSGKLVTQFVECLESDVLTAAPAAVGAANGASPPPAPASVAEDVAVTTSAVGGATPTPPTPAPAPGAPVPTAASDIEGDEAEFGAVLSSGDGSAPIADRDAPQEPVVSHDVLMQARADAQVEARPGVRKIAQPEAEAVDLLDAAGGSVAKRAVPLVAAVLLAVVGWRVLGRGGQAPSPAAVLKRLRRPTPARRPAARRRRLAPARRPVAKGRPAPTLRAVVTRRTVTARRPAPTRRSVVTRRPVVTRRTVATSQVPVAPAKRPRSSVAVKVAPEVADELRRREALASLLGAEVGRRLGKRAVRGKRRARRRAARLGAGARSTTGTR